MNIVRWVTCVAAIVATAHAAEYVLEPYTVDGGGGVSSGGVYVLEGTIGQPDTGVNSAGVYVLSGGFWSGNFGCVVNLTDMLIFADEWLAGSASAADFDGSGQVNIADFAELSYLWLDRCPGDWPLK